MSDAAVSALVTRLEQVTSRLEKVESSLSSGAGASSSSSSSAAGSSASAASGETAAFVSAFDALVADHFAKFVAAADKLGGLVAQQAALVKQAVAAERQVLVTASQSKKPADAQLSAVLAPLSKLIGDIGALREANRASPQFTNLSAVSEGIGALGWVAVAPTPGPFVLEGKSSAEFYTNRLLKDFKGKDQDQVDFANAWINFLKELAAYVKSAHTTGLSWNAKGGDASAAAPAPAAAGATPKGPPSGPPKGFADAPAAAASGKPAAPAAGGGLFAELSKGADVTRGLKKVTDDMKTHKKKPADHTSVVKAKETTVNVKVTKPARLELNGNKWEVEFQVNNKTIVIDETEAKQAVYVYQCVNSTIVIKGKINSIMIDGCTKVALVFDSAISVAEIVNSKSIDIQVLGTVPTIGIDKSSGVNVVLSNDAKSVTEVVSSKIDALNVSWPVGDDFVEAAVPEQFKTVLRDGKLVTEAVRHE